jgi:hypothetical protein
MLEKTRATISKALEELTKAQLQLFIGSQLPIDKTKCLWLCITASANKNTALSDGAVLNCRKEEFKRD